MGKCGAAGASPRRRRPARGVKVPTTAVEDLLQVRVAPVELVAADAASGGAGVLAWVDQAQEQLLCGRLLGLVQGRVFGFGRLDQRARDAAGGVVAGPTAPAWFRGAGARVRAARGQQR